MFWQNEAKFLNNIRPRTKRAKALSGVCYTHLGSVGRLKVPAQPSARPAGGAVLDVKASLCPRPSKIRPSATTLRAKLAKAGSASAGALSTPRHLMLQTSEFGNFNAKLKGSMAVHKAVPPARPDR